MSFEKRILEGMLIAACGGGEGRKGGCSIAISRIQEGEGKAGQKIRMASVWERGGGEQTSWLPMRKKRRRKKKKKRRCPLIRPKVRKEGKKGKRTTG